MPADQLKVVTALSDVIITVVTDDKAMKKIYTGGLLSRARGKLFINCATISPATHVWVEQKCESKGAESRRIRSRWSSGWTFLAFIHIEPRIIGLRL